VDRHFRIRVIGIAMLAVAGATMSDVPGLRVAE
jgi:hypothetical protein